VSANLEDEWVPDLLDAVSDFGFNRIAERGLPEAMEILKNGGGGDRVASAAAALNVLEAAVARERDALRSIHDIHTGSRVARESVDEAVAAWDAYGEALEGFLLDAASPGGIGVLQIPGPSAEELAYDDVVPSLAPGIRGQEFNLGQYDRAQAYFQENPGILNQVGLNNGQTRLILNYVDGQRSVFTIKKRVAAETGDPIDVSQVARYLEILADIGWIELGEGNR
jgi:hypothetical protein